MKRFATLVVAFGLAGGGSTALAEQTKQQLGKQDVKPQPVEMTDKQLDNVAGGLVNVVLVDVVDIERNNVTVAVPVAASVAVAVLGGAVAGTAQRPGRIIQTQ
jgi:hypothetical protein